MKDTVIAVHGELHELNKLNDNKFNLPYRVIHHSYNPQDEKFYIHIRLLLVNASQFNQIENAKTLEEVYKVLQTL